MAGELLQRIGDLQSSAWAVDSMVVRLRFGPAGGAEPSEEADLGDSLAGI